MVKERVLRTNTMFAIIKDIAQQEEEVKLDEEDLQL